jgi:hypothetical protein
MNFEQFSRRILMSSCSMRKCIVLPPRLHPKVKPNKTFALLIRALYSIHMLPLCSQKRDKNLEIQGILSHDEKLISIFSYSLNNHQIL